MRSTLLLIFLMGMYALPAQITLLIEDETETGFRLVANQFLQNSRPVKTIALSEVPTGSNKLLFLMDSVEQIRLSRPLELNQKGTYKYVITRNFEGTLQLRYRGKQGSIPDRYVRETYNQLVAYVPRERKHKMPKSPEDSSRQVTALAVADTQPTVKTEPPAVQDTATVEPDIALAKADSSIKKVSETSQVEKPIATFEERLKGLESQQFEFDKLRFAREKIAPLDLDAEKVVVVLKNFKYDQTRFQFLEEAFKHNPGLKHFTDLFKPEFEYEISRQQVGEKLN